MSRMSNKQSNKSSKKSKTSSSFPIGKVFILFAIFVGFVSYYVYNFFTTPPEIPKLDLNQWWGPYPINPKQDLSIRPYKIEFSDVIINDLKERLLHTRPLTPPLEDAGFTYGFNSNFLRQVVDYWQNKYNFKEREQFLNKYEHYVTNVQGLDIHFMHVKPKVSVDVKVLPLLLLHGWPGSIREFYEIIPMLTTHRSGSKFVFEVIAPSLPGFGFSDAAVRSGLGPTEIAVIMRNLMKRVGRERYYVQGGDWGHAIGAAMATLFPENILGFHTNFPTVSNPMANVYIYLGSLLPSILDEPEVHDRMYPLGEHFYRMMEETGYIHIQATKPDTVGAALSDSPAGLAAYILEKFSTWTDPEFRKFGDGKLLNKYQLTHLLDNVMIYWATNSITTSMRLYSEAFSAKHMAAKMDQIPTEVPTWGIKFKYELIYHPDCVLKLKYKNYLHSTVVDDGGHFAAFENPDVLSNDIYDAVKAFRQFHGGSTTQNAPTEKKTLKTIYDFTVKDINGKEIKLDRYKGHVVIIVNVASQCGLTDNNYRELNELYEKYGQSRGLRILAFPCNQFGSQEPGTPKDILKFTKEKGVKFDLFEKIEVNGDNTHPLWKFLKQTQSGTMGDFIKWNFSKFIIDKSGVPVERLGPNVNPSDLEPYLAKYW